MKVISTKAHGVMDYAMALLLMASPWIFNFSDHRVATTIPILLGVATICYSLITNYELSIAKALSMRAHLLLDALSGVVLAASPWLAGFSDYVYLPHLILGLTEVAIVVITDPVPYQHGLNEHGSSTNPGTAQHT
jgi:hypothetical protein